MKAGSTFKKHCYATRIVIFLITTVLIATTTACSGFIEFDVEVDIPSMDLEIRTWYDLNAVRYNLRGHHRLMNDLDSITAGYEKFAGPTANCGKGWEPIGPGVLPLRGIFDFRGSFDGQGHEIRDLVINRPNENQVGLFGSVFGGVIKNVGTVNASVIGNCMVGGLAGEIFKGTVNKSYFSGNVTGGEMVGGLVGSHYYAAIRDCYSSGNITGQMSVGGLVGKNEGVVNNSYSNAGVTGNYCVGGLIGKGGIFVGNSFWDVEVSGVKESAGGTGKNTAEMMDIATLIDIKTEGLDSPWNITRLEHFNPEKPSAWYIEQGIDYPRLYFQHPDYSYLALPHS